jgi:FtsZ-binding cell division protein ZapB
MNSDHEANNIPHSSSSRLEDSCLEAGLQAECERLRQRIAELEAEHERDRHRFVELERERDHYRAEAYSWARREFERDGTLTDEAVKHAIEHEDGVPLEAFLDELERIAKGS